MSTGQYKPTYNDCIGTLATNLTELGWRLRKIRLQSERIYGQTLTDYAMVSALPLDEVLELEKTVVLINEKLARRVKHNGILPKSIAYPTKSQKNI